MALWASIIVSPLVFLANLSLVYALLPVACASAYTRYLPRTRQSPICSPSYSAREGARDSASSTVRSPSR